jgi:hypothetical protein
VDFTTEYPLQSVWIGHSCRELGILILTSAVLKLHPGGMPMGHYEGGHNGGKLAEKFRRAFEDAVEAFVAWQYFQHPEPKVWLDFDDEEHGEITVSRACGLVWNCTDLLPREVSSRIQWLEWGLPLPEPIGMTYACGARRLLPLIEWRRTLDHPPVRYEPRKQTEAVEPPSSALARAEERIGGIAPPPTLSDSDIEKIIDDAIEEAFDESKKPAAPIEEISPEAEQAIRELARLFGSDADDEPSNTPPKEKPK